MYEPLTESELDHRAAKRALAFQSGWTLDPSIFGDYPEEIKEYLGSALPSFSLDEKNYMKNSIDFIGINHYSTTYAKDCTNSSCCGATENRAIQGFVGTVGERDGVLIGEIVGNYNTAMGGSYVVPRGMQEIVNHIKIRYSNKPMFITENGYSSPDVREQRVIELMNDVKRVEFHARYLAHLAKSIRHSSEEKLFEIAEGEQMCVDISYGHLWIAINGYNVRFGLYYVDRQTLTQIPKLSARWYKNFLTNKTANVCISSGGVRNSLLGSQEMGGVRNESVGKCDHV
ncbi:putative beta-glucosidase [Helianthus debilis subsp. tardiflorus]